MCAIETRIFCPQNTKARFCTRKVLAFRRRSSEIPIPHYKTITQKLSQVVWSSFAIIKIHDISATTCAMVA
jgi:hypothetical protein